MSIEKKSLISTLSTTKKANVATGTTPVAPQKSQVISKQLNKTLSRTVSRSLNRNTTRRIQ